MDYCRWTEYSEKCAKENGIVFAEREDYETPNTIDLYDFFVVDNGIAEGTNSPATFMGDEVVYCKKGKIELKPTLTALDIDIGGMFLYMDNVWVRTDTYMATCTKYGACYFGPIGSAEEFESFLDEAEKLSMPRIESLLLNTGLPYIRIEKE